MPQPMSDAVGAHCELSHPAFRMFCPVVFRRAETDGMPAMVVSLGDRLAVLPLATLQREFAIPPDSADGRMLGLIAESLGYVAGLRPGDPLPPEVWSGEASWSPEPRHLAIAGTRLRRNLLAAFGIERAMEADARLAGDAALRGAVQGAFERAADALGLSSRAEVLDLLEQLAGECAYIEALREALLPALGALCRRLAMLGADWRGDADRQETLGQVRRLAGIAHDHLAARFATIDAATAAVLGSLRRLDARRTMLRRERDRLHRTRRSFLPMLAEWEGASPVLDEAAWGRLARTYRFLAPRFMQVQEWERATAPRARGAGPVYGTVMQW